MWQKISNFILMSYLSFIGFTRRLKNDELGLSDLVVSVLLILVAILAVVLFWAFLGEWLQDLWDRMRTADSEII